MDWDGIVMSSREYQGPDNPAKWPAACRIFASLQQLQSAHFVIREYDIGSFECTDTEMLYILEPLGAVRAPDFIVNLPTDVSTSVRAQLAPFPFQLRIGRERQR